MSENSPIRPFAHVRLAQQHGARLPEPARDEGIVPRPRPHQGEGAGRGQHLVGGVDVVFQQDGDAVQWPAWPTGAQFVVEGGGDLHGLGVALDHAATPRTVTVERLDAGEVHRNQVLNRQRPGPQVGPQVGNRRSIHLGNGS